MLEDHERRKLIEKMALHSWDRHGQNGDGSLIKNGILTLENAIKTIKNVIENHETSCFIREPDQASPTDTTPSGSQRF